MAQNSLCSKCRHGTGKDYQCRRPGKKEHNPVIKFHKCKYFEAKPYFPIRKVSLLNCEKCGNDLVWNEKKWGIRKNDGVLSRIGNYVCKKCGWTSPLTEVEFPLPSNFKELPPVAVQNRQRFLKL